MSAMAGASPSAVPKLDSVQVLRAFAALIVVIGHVAGIVRHRPDLFGELPPLYLPGGAGVDMFFLVSGFIMVIASRRMFGSATGSVDFLLRRLLRIVPLYWATTALVVVMMALGRRGIPSLEAIVASLAFFPYDTTGRGDGFAFPIVDLGWTLNYEMLFYLVFALFIPLGRLRGVLAVVATMAALVILGHAVAFDAIALRFFTRPIVLEFAAGTLVALLYGTGRLKAGVAARLALAVAAVGVLLLDPCHLVGPVTTPNSFARAIGWGIPSTMLLVAAVSGPMRLESIVGRGAVGLGDASYALYLLHPFILVAMTRAATSGRLAVGGVSFILITVVLACVFAVIAHKWIEWPVTARLTRLLPHRAGVAVTVPLPPDA